MYNFSLVYFVFFFWIYSLCGVVLIVDPAISNQASGYKPYEDGMKMDIFIKVREPQCLRWPKSQLFPFVHASITSTSASSVIVVSEAIIASLATITYSVYVLFKNYMIISCSLIQDNNDKVFVGKVWPGSTVYPDFLHPNASQYWEKQVRTA